MSTFALNVKKGVYDNKWWCSHLTLKLTDVLVNRKSQGIFVIVYLLQCSDVVLSGGQHTGLPENWLV